MGVKTMWAADHIATSINLHSHDYYQLIYCRGGCGGFEIRGQYYKAEPGMAYLVRPMCVHSIMQTEGLHITEIKFRTEGLPFDNALKQLPTKFKIEGNDSLGILFSQTVNTWLESTVTTRNEADFSLLLFLTAVIRCYTGVSSDGIGEDSVYADSDDKNGSNGSTTADLLFVADYIEKHLNEQLTLDDLVDLVHLDKSYLIVKFKQQWGVPPMKYMNWLRIERAKGLLAATNMSITDIAAEVGFQSVHYFSRFFKEKENMSPNDYRILRAIPIELPPTTSFPMDGCASDNGCF